MHQSGFGGSAAMQRIRESGLVICGCGKMGSALLKGWLDQGMVPDSVTVMEPQPSTWLLSLAGESGIHLNTPARPPAVCVIAVKPQVMTSVLDELRSFGNKETVILSIAAGVKIRQYEAMLGDRTPVIRAMPNTPAAVGKGITAIVGNSRAANSDMDLATALLNTVGKTVRLDNEDDMDLVTAISGSGPAYVFLLIEALASAGEARGFPPDLALEMAMATVVGAASLAESSSETPAQLRRNVTSPGGTTAAALEILMDESRGMAEIISQAVDAAADRSRSLGS